MKRISYQWNDEYREQFYKSEKVQEHLKDFIAQAKQPKSQATKDKMSAAKAGVSKSKDHRKNMSETHKFRNSLRRDILARDPSIPKDQVWNLVREEMYADSDRDNN